MQYCKVTAAWTPNESWVFMSWMRPSRAAWGPVRCPWLLSMVLILPGSPLPLLPSLVNWVWEEMKGEGWLCICAASYVLKRGGKRQFKTSSNRSKNVDQEGFLVAKGKRPWRDEGDSAWRVRQLRLDSFPHAVIDGKGMNSMCFQMRLQRMWKLLGDSSGDDSPKQCHV